MKAGSSVPHGIDNAAEVRRPRNPLWLVAILLVLLFIASIVVWRLATIGRSWSDAATLLDVTVGFDGAIATVVALLLAWHEFWRSGTPNALAFEAPRGTTIEIAMGQVRALEGKPAPIALTPPWRLRNHGPGTADIRSLEVQVQVINDYDIDESWSFFSLRVEPEVRSAMAGNTGPMWRQIGDADLAYWEAGGWAIEEGDAIELRRFLLFVKSAAEVEGLRRNHNPTVRMRLVVNTVRGGDVRRMRFPLVFTGELAAEDRALADAEE